MALTFLHSLHIMALHLVMSSRNVLFFVLLIFLVAKVDCSTKVHTKVLTQQGYVKGVQQKIQTYQGQTKTIYKFLGVPYAKKPLGNLRFKPPQALSNRRSTDYDATFLRPICYQDEYYLDSVRGAWPEFDPETDMSEDCLYLNIYIPSRRATKKYPVIFYIHGGGYFSGTPTRDISPGEYLPTQDVVLVTIQYRLAGFGFFTTGDSEVPGNMGLLDQVEALKWVQQNIEGFGGDKNSVTLLGESAGGCSIGLHYVSPLSRGLFHRGIAVSAVDLLSLSYKPKSIVLEASNGLVEQVNCTKQSARETIYCLQSLPASTIVKTPQFLSVYPFVDHHFLPDESKMLREEGRFQKLPLMSGFTSQDGSFIVALAGNYTTPFLRFFSEYIFQREVLRASNKEAQDAYNVIVSKYKLNIENSKQLRRNIIDMMSDHFFKASTHAALTVHSDHGVPTYMFEFAHRSRNHPKPKWMGVVHEDTTAYKFGLPLLNSQNSQRFDDDDKEVSDMLVTMFTNFAKTGNPTPSPVHGAEWEPFDSSNKAYLKIQKNPVMKNHYRPNRMHFWNTEFPKLLPNNTNEESESSDAVKKPGKLKFYRIRW